MAGNTVTELYKGQAEHPEQPPNLRGYISTNRPAPTGFPKKGSTENLVWVIVRGYSLERPLGPCQWGAIHGATLPAQGAEVVVAIDTQGIPTVVWWDGEHT